MRLKKTGIIAVIIIGIITFALVLTGIKGSFNKVEQSKNEQTNLITNLDNKVQTLENIIPKADQAQVNSPTETEELRSKDK